MMNRKLLIYFIAFISSGVLLSSCEKYNGDVVIPSSQLSFGVIADSPTSTLPTAIGGSTFVVNGPVGTASVTWSSGIANISGFKFIAKKRGVPVELSAMNAAKIDLFTPGPLTANIQLDTGTYTDVEIRIILSKTNTADFPVIIKGSFQSVGGAIVPIELDFNDDLIIGVPAGSVSADGIKDITAKISIHLNKLLETITATQIDAAKRTNGTILITNTTNPALYGQIIGSLLKCGGSNGFEKHDKGK